MDKKTGKHNFWKELLLYLDNTKWEVCQLCHMDPKAAVTGTRFHLQAENRVSIFLYHKDFNKCWYLSTQEYEFNLLHHDMILKTPASVNKQLQYSLYGNGALQIPYTVKVF